MSWAVEPIRANKLNLPEDGVNAPAVTSGTDTCSSGTYQNLAGTGSQTSVTIEKKQDGSRLRIDMHAGFYSSATTSGAIFGVRINSIDYDVAELRATLPAANAHLSASGVLYISGIAAGSVTVQGRWKRGEGAGTLTRDTLDRLSFSVKETVE